MSDALLDVAQAVNVVFAGPEKNKRQVLFYGKDKGEKIKFFPVAASPLSGVAPAQKIQSGFLLMKGILQSMQILRSERPDAVVGMGAYFSVPVALAARLLHVPVFLHEQNAIPGKATRLLSRFAEKIFVSFDSTADYFKERQKVSVTGNPVRSLPAGASKKDILQSAGLSEAQKTVLIFGGSHGAKKINDAVLAAQNCISSQSKFQVIHVTGEFDYARVKEASGHAKNYAAFPYLENIMEFMAVSDLVVCRAGATTCAELLTLGKPSILIPYPYATDQHQLENAEQFVKHGAGAILLDEHVTGELLKVLLEGLLLNEGARHKMITACGKMAKPDAARALAKEILTALRHSF